LDLGDWFATSYISSNQEVLRLNASNLSQQLIFQKLNPMNFQQYDLGQKSGGEVYQITLRGTEANVRLMDSSNFQSYRRGGRHEYVGGHYKQSPVTLRVPNAGRWFIVIDLGGYAGTVNSSVRQIG
jgi:hypothetical protein